MTYSVKDYCDIITKLSKQRKTDACHMNRGVAETTSFVSLSYRNDIMTIEGSATGNPVENLPQVLDQVIQTGVVKFDTLAFTAEVLLRRVDVAEIRDEELKAMVKNYKRGDLEREFRENPSTDVVEGLFTYAIGWEGDTAYSFTEVKYGDNGQPVYGEPEDSSDDSTASRMSGSVERTMKDYRKHCRSLLSDDEGQSYSKAFDELYDDVGNLRDAVAYIKGLEDKAK
jgi:hypothetical protein